MLGPPKQTDTLNQQIKQDQPSKPFLLDGAVTYNTKCRNAVLSTSFSTPDNTKPAVARITTKHVCAQQSLLKPQPMRLTASHLRPSQKVKKQALAQIRTKRVFAQPAPQFLESVFAVREDIPAQQKKMRLERLWWIT